MKIMKRASAAMLALLLALSLCGCGKLGDSEVSSAVSSAVSKTESYTIDITKSPFKDVDSIEYYLTLPSKQYVKITERADIDELLSLLDGLTFEKLDQIPLIGASPVAGFDGEQQIFTLSGNCEFMSVGETFYKLDKSCAEKGDKVDMAWRRIAKKYEVYEK